MSKLEQTGRYTAATGLVGAATVVGLLARPLLAQPDMVMLYLLGIMAVAACWGRGPSVLAAALSVATYDFFFVPPFHTLTVADLRHLLTFATMFVVGLVISGFTVRLRRQEQEARVRERRTAALYGLSRDLGAAVGEADVARAIVRRASEDFAAAAAVLVPDASGGLSVAARAGEVTIDAPQLAAARRVLGDAGREARANGESSFHPLRSGAAVVGVLALAPVEGLSERRDFLDAFVRQSALALERAQLAEHAKAAVLRARTEEMRSSLLSAVSHDLRTPLAAITGAATTLRDLSGQLSPPQRDELVETVCDEAERLERLVGNLLDMTRLDSGALQVKREWVPLEELVGSALARMEAPLAGRRIRVDLPADLPLTAVDPVLIEQVLVNLLENAAKYTPPTSPLDLSAHVADGALAVDVADRGPGLPPGAEAQVFQKFVRGAHAGIPGVGLGLSIARGIVEAHGGTLVALPRDGGGARFRFTLPDQGAAPQVALDSGAARE